MNILVVGAGFAGATVARVLAEAGHKVSVIEKRDHVAGNAYDYINEYGIRVHKYGPHLFHTNNQKVFDWLSRFTDWVEYKHKVKALLSDGTYATLPVNRETKELVGEENVLDVFFRPYTLKMWGVPLDELNPKIIERVPIRDDDNELYFPNDEFQYMPIDGYTQLVKNMLDHENIIVMLDTEFVRAGGFDHVFNSMPIDEYYKYRHGRLPYRSIKFSTVTVPGGQLLPTTTVNFTHDKPQTRVTEWKNIPCHGDNPAFTTLTVETPCDYVDNDYERYYPVKDLSGVNDAIYKKYRDIENDKMTFIGRCGTYQYLDMHQVVNQSIIIAEKFLSA